MCGFAGMMALAGRSVDPALLRRMNQALGHRGPDGQGQYIQDTLGLTHCRLSIIDLEGGAQPLFDNHGRVLVANGEVYNSPELRQEFPVYPFATGSDCEVCLPLYDRNGVGFAAALRGMYGLALFDPQSERLLLARDPFGIKPLYYAQGPWGIVFASEAQAILATGLVSPEVLPDRRAELLQVHFTVGAKTIFAGIERVLPGETLVIQKGRIVARQQISALPAGQHDGGLDALDRVLEDSVRVHQRSDVPYGMFLSGGLDSSALLALMARLNQTPVLAFTAFFPQTSVHDESAHAAQLAQSVGAEHICVPFVEQDFWTLLPKVAALMDDPVADYAILPTYKLAAEASRQVKVILSGEGGDEMFGGYGRYRGAMRPWPFTRRMLRQGSFDGLNLFRPEVLSGWRAGIAQVEQQIATQARQERWSRLQRAQAMDCADWLPNDLLLKADRCLMAHGLEGRVPFLDRDVAKFAFALPDWRKIEKRLGKWILRQWLEKFFPLSHPFSRKRGFTVPVSTWIAARPEVGERIAQQAGIAEIASAEVVKDLFRSKDAKVGMACWILLFYALWHEHHIVGRDAAAVLDG